MNLLLPAVSENQLFSLKKSIEHEIQIDMPGTYGACISKILYCR